MSARQNTVVDRWTRVGLAAASGLALAAAFPKFDLNLFAWVAFVPLFFVIERQPLSRVFGYSWLQGFICFAGSLYWIVTTLHNFADVPTALAVLPMLLLAAIMALYTAAAICSGEFIARALAIPAVVTVPITWVAIEWVRT